MAFLVGIVAVLEIALLLAVFVLPSVIVALRYAGGWKAALGASVLVLAGTAVLGGTEAALVIAEFVGIGGLLAFFFPRGKSATVVFLGAFGCFAASIVAAGVAIAVMGGPAEAPPSRIAESLLVQVVDMQGELAIESGQADEIDVAFQKDRALRIVRAVGIAFPAVFAVGVAMLILANMLVARDVLAARLVPLPFARLTEWRASDWLIWPVIVAGFGVFLGRGSWLFRPSVNVLVVALIPFLFQGMSITSHFLNRWGIPRWLRTLLWAFSVPQLWIVATVPVGLFDVWVDFRRPRVPRKGAAGGPPDEDGR